MGFREWLFGPIEAVEAAESFAEETRSGIRYTETNDNGDVLYSAYVGNPSPFANAFAQVSPWDVLFSIPAARRCATLIADTIAGLPRRAYSNYGNKDSKIVEVSILERPYNQESGLDTFRAWVLDFVLNGNAIGLIVRDLRGSIIAIVPVDSTGVDIFQNERTGRIVYQIGNTQYEQYEIFHVKGLCRPGELRGKGVLEHGKSAIAFSKTSASQWTSHFNSGVPTGLLTPDSDTIDDDGEALTLTKEEAAAIKQAWQDQATGGVMILNGWKYTPVSWTVTELELVNASKLSDLQFANLFGIPAYFVGAEGSSKTYSNAQDQGRELLTYSLLGIILAFEEALSNILPNKTTVKFIPEGLLKADQEKRYEAYGKALNNKPWMTVDEVRALDDRKPLTPKQKKELGLDNDTDEPETPIEEDA